MPRKVRRSKASTHHHSKSDGDEKLEFAGWENPLMPTTPPTTPPAMAPACEDLLDFTAVGLGSFELVEVELPEVELLCFFINN